MKISQIKLLLITALVIVACPFSTFAKNAGKPTIGIHRVAITESIKKTMATKGQNKVLSLQRVADSLGQQLIDRIHNTRKFKIISRSDLKTLLKDQDLQRVLSDPSDKNVAQALKIAGCKYALIITIDDFQDLKEDLKVEGGLVLATKRTVRLSAVMKIYNVTTGELLETANFQLKPEPFKVKPHLGSVADDAKGGQILTAVARDMAHKASNRVLDVIYPAKIIAMTGKLVTLNRGDGTGIKKGQVWIVYALGQDLKDPDTGESLGTEEVPIGKIKIVNVTPKFSQGKIIEDLGIEKLQIVREVETDPLDKTKH